MKTKYAFTLSEVLITLAIIGVVAVMTIPTLSRNIKQREFWVAHKRINSIMSNAIAFVEANDGIRSAENAGDFVENYLSKYLRIAKICGYENHESCGFNTDTNGVHRIDDVRMTFPTTMDELQTNLLSYQPENDNAYATGSSLEDIDRRGYSFLTNNGYSMMLFYNPNCSDDSYVAHYVQNKVCVNVVWDMNGLADPNTVAQDIGFTTVLYPRYASTVTPMAYKSSTGSTFDNANEKCTSYAGEDYKVPNRDELASLYFNGALIYQTTGGFWSASPVSAELGWYQNFLVGHRHHHTRSSSGNLRCVRR